MKQQHINLFLLLLSIGVGRSTTYGHDGTGAFSKSFSSSSSSSSSSSAFSSSFSSAGADLLDPLKVGSQAFSSASSNADANGALTNAGSLANALSGSSAGSFASSGSSAGSGSQAGSVAFSGAESGAKSNAGSVSYSGSESGAKSNAGAVSFSGSGSDTKSNAGSGSGTNAGLSGAGSYNAGLDVNSKGISGTGIFPGTNTAGSSSFSGASSQSGAVSFSGSGSGSKSSSGSGSYNTGTIPNSGVNLQKGSYDSGFQKTGSDTYNSPSGLIQGSTPISNGCSKSGCAGGGGSYSGSGTYAGLKPIGQASPQQQISGVVSNVPSNVNVNDFQIPVGEFPDSKNIPPKQFPGPSGSIHDFKPAPPGGGGPPSWTSSQQPIPHQPPQVPSYGHTGSNAGVQINIDEDSYKPGGCRSCQGPFPGPKGSIHDFKPVDHKQTAVAPAIIITEQETVPTSVPFVKPSLDIISKLPGSPGNIHEFKPVTSGGSIPVAVVPVPAGGSYYNQEHQIPPNNYQPETHPKPGSIAILISGKLPGSPGNIYTSTSPGQNQYKPQEKPFDNKFPSHNKPPVKTVDIIGILPGKPGSIYDSKPIPGPDCSQGQCNKQPGLDLSFVPLEPYDKKPGVIDCTHGQCDEYAGKLGCHGEECYGPGRKHVHSTSESKHFHHHSQAGHKPDCSRGQCNNGGAYYPVEPLPGKPGKICSGKQCLTNVEPEHIQPIIVVTQPIIPVPVIPQLDIDLNPPKLPQSGCYGNSCGYKPNKNEKPNQSTGYTHSLSSGNAVAIPVPVVPQYNVDFNHPKPAQSNCAGNSCGYKPNKNEKPNQSTGYTHSLSSGNADAIPVPVIPQYNVDFNQPKPAQSNCAGNSCGYKPNKNEKPNQSTGYTHSLSSGNAVAIPVPVVPQYNVDFNHPKPTQSNCAGNSCGYQPNKEKPSGHTYSISGANANAQTEQEKIKGNDKPNFVIPIEVEIPRNPPPHPTFSTQNPTPVQTKPQGSMDFLLPGNKPHHPPHHPKPSHEKQPDHPTDNTYYTCTGSSCPLPTPSSNHPIKTEEKENIFPPPFIPPVETNVDVINIPQGNTVPTYGNQLGEHTSTAGSGAHSDGFVSGNVVVHKNDGTQVPVLNVHIPSLNAADQNCKEGKCNVPSNNGAYGGGNAGGSTGVYSLSSGQIPIPDGKIPNINKGATADAHSGSQTNLCGNGNCGHGINGIQFGHSQSGAQSGSHSGSSNYEGVNGGCKTCGPSSPGSGSYSGSGASAGSGAYSSSSSGAFSGSGASAGSGAYSSSSSGAFSGSGSSNGAFGGSGSSSGNFGGSGSSNGVFSGKGSSNGASSGSGSSSGNFGGSGSSNGDSVSGSSNGGISGSGSSSGAFSNSGSSSGAFGGSGASSGAFSSASSSSGSGATSGAFSSSNAGSFSSADGAAGPKDSINALTDLLSQSIKDTGFGPGLPGSGGVSKSNSFAQSGASSAGSSSSAFSSAYSSAGSTSY